MKKRLLYVDRNELFKYQQYENSLKEAYNELMTVAEKALGIDKITDLKKYLESPKEYLVLEYWSMYCDHKPEHLDKENVFTKDTGIDLFKVDKLKAKYDKSYKLLGDHKPAVNGSEIKYRVKKDLFNRYLNKEKEAHFDALNEFLDAAKKLKEFEKNNPVIHLVRCSNNIRISNLEPEIIKERFI